MAVMDPRHRKEVLGQWGVREESALERAERETLERELEGQPYRGRRIAQRPQFFHRSAESYVASRGGPLPYMLRLREIAAELDEHEARLASTWRDLAYAHRGDSAGFEGSWRRIAERWDFEGVNELIERHNRFYPAEARLPMDVRRRDFALVNGEEYSIRALDAAWILERFPAVLEAAQPPGESGRPLLDSHGGRAERTLEAAQPPGESGRPLLDSHGGRAERARSPSRP
jgi:hypothetical protein